MIFHDRRHAGRLLAQRLQKYKKKNTFVLALPRGGVPIAAEIATALGAPLDVLIVRKIGAPFQSELAVGAICEEGEPIWNDPILYKLGLEPDDLGRTVDIERKKVKNQIKLFRASRKLPSVAGKAVIIVDDGLATGATMSAAIKYLKSKGTVKIVVAVPVAAANTASKLRTKVDEIAAIEVREDLMSVGQWYEDFSQVTDDEVVALLQKNTDGSKRIEKEIEIPLDKVRLKGDLTAFSSMEALIIFAHGSGSSRKSPRNQQVARYLNESGFGTLLFDLLTDMEAQDRGNVFNIEFLSDRLTSATRWLRGQSNLEDLPFGFFGASTGAGAAIQAASELNEKESVFAIVSRGGRPDLAGGALKTVKAPTLLLVGGQDFGIIELNQQAQQALMNCDLSIVPKATHLFEEPGTLEEVSRRAAEWFHDHLPVQKKIAQDTSRSELENAILSSMVALRTENDLDFLVQSIKDKRVVMLGESSHGTAEFYQLRSEISKRLIKDHGFKFIAVEGDWPDAYRLNKYIQTGEGGNAKNVLMHNHRWPTWMWANEEIVKLAEWMRNCRAGFYGLDVYSLFESIDEVVGYLKKNEPTLAQEINRRYACFDPFESDEISYARSLLEYPTGCENEVLLNLQKLLEMRVKNWAQDGDELFSSQQNARIVANAEAYYRAMLSADSSSWNIRDGHMMETLDRLFERAGEDAKAIVWAHNTHIGDYRATDMKAAGYVNIGGLARQSYGDENVALVGFGTYEGAVLAGLAWGAPEQVMPLPRAQEGSYEYAFHKVALKKNVDRFFILLEDEKHSPFAQRLGHRAVGVVYDPRHERRGNYVPTELSKRYDAFVFVDRSHALRSLHAVFIHGEFPETWLTGQ
jgi:erythromycin esterase-like protein/predicted phosphoribosyltransferase/dienelactone hydrolase